MTKHDSKLARSVAALRGAPQLETREGDDDLAEINKALAEIERKTAEAVKNGEGIEAMTKTMGEMKARLEDLEIKANRPRGGIGGRSENSEVKTAFVNAMLTGQGIEAKAMSGTEGPKGGFAVPTEITNIVMNQLRDISPVRSVAEVVQTDSPDYRKLIGLRGAASGWTGETGTRAETETQDLGYVSPSFGEIYAYATVTRHVLEDASFDLEAWLKETIVTEFAVKEGAAFVAGNGVTKPSGFLTGSTPTTEADSARTFGTLQYLATGADGAFAAAPNAGDKLVDLVYSLRAGYRKDAVWMMNSATAGAVRKLKDSEGRFLWSDSLVAGQPPTLLGYPVIIAEDMPAIASGAFSIAFGDFRRGYLVADRGALVMVRDEVTKPGFIKFYVAKRVGGTISDSDAIKLLKFATS